MVSIKITVIDCVTLEEYSIEVDTLARVEELTRKIQTCIKFGTSMDIIFFNSERQLQKEKTLYFYGLTDNSKILMVFYKIGKPPTSEFFQERRCRFLDILGGEKKLDKNGDKIVVVVVDVVTREEHLVEIEKFSTVQDLIKKIKNGVNLSDSMDIILFNTQYQLEKDRRLEYYGLINKSKILMTFYHISNPPTFEFFQKGMSRFLDLLGHEKKMEEKTMNEAQPMGKENKKIVIVDPLHSPEAIIKWRDHKRENKPTSKSMALKARRHLSAVGWEFWDVLKANTRYELRYLSPIPNSKISPEPNRKYYYSLVGACEAQIDIERGSAKSHEKTQENEKEGRIEEENPEDEEDEENIEDEDDKRSRSENKDEDGSTPS